MRGFVLPDITSVPARGLRFVEIVELFFDHFALKKTPRPDRLPGSDQHGAQIPGWYQSAMRRNAPGATAPPPWYQASPEAREAIVFQSDFPYAHGIPR